MLCHWFSYIIFILLVTVPGVSFSQSTDSPDTEATTPQTQTVDQQTSVDGKKQKISILI